MRKETLLCVASFPTNTGFAWTFLEGLYAAIADRLAPEGVRTLVAYPRVLDPPRTLAGSAALPVELDATLTKLASVRATMAFVRRQRVGVILAIDQAPRQFAFPLLRLAGVHHIVVYDHGSGLRPRGHPIKWPLKWLLPRLPGVGADVVLAVSDFVVRRQVNSWWTPARKVRRLWNGIRVPDTAPDALDIHSTFSLPHGSPVVLAASRATPEKGVDFLLRAFDRVATAVDCPTPAPVLVYCGDGPALPELQRLRESLASRDRIILAGKRSDIPSLIVASDVCVVPSVWEDALPLSVLEPMALGKAVIGTRTGGIPEMIVDQETGLLVPPRDLDALADAMRILLADPVLRRRMGAAGRARVRAEFSVEEQVERLTEAVRPGTAGASSR